MEQTVFRKKERCCVCYLPSTDDNVYWYNITHWIGDSTVCASGQKYLLMQTLLPVNIAQYFYVKFLYQIEIKS